MVENDDRWMRQQPADQINKAQANTAAHSLITKERMQKLDLLVHLLSNLPQALVVCGPEGIGKTMLLKVLQERKTESWRYCLIQGNADLSFEAIHGQLTQCIKQDKTDTPVKSLSMAFKQYENQHKQVVLIVDNAGELVPGLIAAIIQYAAANPILRVVFALTHDELQVKRGSDRAVDDCHIVEIPPLSEKQCGDFLQYLSTKPYANLSFKAISENMIAHIYRETHGVPGRIITEISGLSGAKQGGKLKWVLVLAVAAACAIAFGVQWLTSSKNNDKEVIAPASVEQKAGNIEMIPPRPETQIMLTLPPAQPAIQPQEESAPVNQGNEAKEALEPSVEVNTRRDDQQPVASTAKSETASTLVIKQQPENKPSDGVQQKISGPLGASREKPKQSELSKTVNNVEPSMPNNPELIQIPPKPVEVAADPEEPVMKTATPQQVEPDRIGSLPIATLPPSLAVEESLAQSANNFTLQLMVLSKQSSVNDILKKYPAMEPDFRVINTVAKGKEKFILEYGSYPDTASADKARQSLPFEFHNALVKKISSAKHR